MRIRARNKISATPKMVDRWDRIRRATHPRRGSVLLVVSVIVVMLTLGVYTFNELAHTELSAVTMYGRDGQTRQLAESGIELAAALVDRRANLDDEDFYSRADLFQGVVVRESTRTRGRGRFSVVAPIESDPSAQSVRFGVIDESGKLNLNALMEWGLTEQESANALGEIPGMTPEIADAILDWIDKDSKKRPFGAEGLYYRSLPQPYTIANRPLRSIDELLAVRGVTPELLYGEDQNRDGLLDPREDDGDQMLRLGWDAYLTIMGRESNRQAEGEKRIHLNQNVLATLYDELEDEFDETTARFVAAYRMTGAHNSEQEPGGRPNRASARASATSVVSSTATTSGSSSDDRDETTGRKKNKDPTKEELEANKRPENAKRGGMDLTPGPKVTINSLFDLVDVKAAATIDGSQQVIESPWKSGDPSLRTMLPIVEDLLTASDKDFIVGRVNIRHAHREVLGGLPGMTPTLADVIGRESSAHPGGSFDADRSARRQSIGWLLLERHATVEQMRKIDRYLTTRGHVYRVRSIGYYDAGGPTTRLEAVIDATAVPAKIVSVRDMTDLGSNRVHTLLSVSE